MLQDWSNISPKICILLFFTTLSFWYPLCMSSLCWYYMFCGRNQWQIHGNVMLHIASPHQDLMVRHVLYDVPCQGGTQLKSFLVLLGSFFQRLNRISTVITFIARFIYKSGVKSFSGFPRSSSNAIVEHLWKFPVSFSRGHSIMKQEGSGNFYVHKNITIKVHITLFTRKRCQLYKWCYTLTN